ELCDTGCSDHMYFGSNTVREFWCGDITRRSLAAESECPFPCSGNPKQICSAGGYINLWARPWSVPTPVS
ncbi:hypothetical protein V8F20_010305, partial [Naviculisporaceae sp. PSN 640]